ncbi:MAG: response regulator [Elusimicrobiota bacterium]
MKELIYIVDDEPDILELVDHHLEKAGFKSEGFLESESFFGALEKKVPDLIILDLMLPDIDGMDICRDLKRDYKYSDIPIIMLTARGEEVDRILGLELGADDYVTKPFSPKELVARVKAVLRRGKKIEKSENITIGNLKVDPKKFSASVDGKKVNLTATEFNILKILASRKGWVFSREKLLDELWGFEKAVLDRTIDVHIKNLRDKLGKAGKLIKNVRGVGYKIEE